MEAQEEAEAINFRRVDSNSGPVPVIKTAPVVVKNRVIPVKAVLIYGLR